MTLFDTRAEALRFAWQYEDARREYNDGVLPEGEAMTVALLDDGQYAVANVEWIYGLLQNHLVLIIR